MALTTLANYLNPLKDYLDGDTGEVERPQQSRNIHICGSPYIGPIPGGLTVGKQVFIQATVPLHENGFSINFACGPGVNPRSETAFHFNPRFNENCVVRNTYRGGKWEQEERYGTLPFNKNYPFEVIILVESSQYKVAVNGTHFTEYGHRIPIHRVTHLTVEGGIQIHAVRFDAPAPPPPMSYPAPATGYPPQPLYNPSVPLTTSVQGGMFPGKMIFISGDVKPSGNRFTINIQDGMDGSCDKALHFDVRLNFGGCVNTIVRNHYSMGQWGTEEKYQPFFPFNRGSHFEMIILAESKEFKVAVNNQHFVEFKHRAGPLGRFNVLNITGDINLQQVRFQ